MLDDNLKAQLGTYLERVTQPFEIVASLSDSESSRDMLSLLQTIQGRDELDRLGDLLQIGFQLSLEFRVQHDGSRFREVCRRDATGRGGCTAPTVTFGSWVFP